MKKIILLIMALFLVAGAAYAKEEYKKKAGDYNVTITLDKSPSVGQNDVTVNIKDAKGKDVTDANVVVEYINAAHAGNGAHELQNESRAEGRILPGPA